MAWNPVCEYDTITEHVEIVESSNQSNFYFSLALLSCYFSYFKLES